MSRPGLPGPTRLVRPDQLIPPHEVRDPKKHRALTEGMLANGWQGRPVVALDTGNGVIALTGSHRLAAAADAGVECVPVYLLDTEIMEVAFAATETDLDDLSRTDQADMAEFLREAGEDNGHALMEAE